ncbi:hypothetical protein IHE44_0005639 [Lamprotornis superbus]|uniref:Alpha-2-macroglobulin-like protein 1 n=1 Tax=Lamprotornis superbus TaxID=245042 RepID=A0A835TS74_9PASS|nr:hypothetical protein IHE44_0005639 [Lamprotornis superbus]
MPRSSLLIVVARPPELESCDIKSDLAVFSGVELHPWERQGAQAAQQPAGYSWVTSAAEEAKKHKWPHQIETKAVSRRSTQLLPRLDTRSSLGFKTKVEIRLLVAGIHYMVVFPAIIQQSCEEKLYIHFSSLTEAVHLVVTLQTKTQNHTLVEQDVEKPGTFQSITFQPEEVAFLHILIHSGDNVLLKGHKKVLVKPQKNIILIETDKGLYKPGETVKFRIVNLDDNLKVIKNEYSQIWLQDPEYNRIAEWLNVKSNHGIVDLSFPLASEASLGKYTISVQQDMAQRTFSVEEYVLKKFEIKVEHPPHITTADEEFLLSVCGKYTYGMPVQGKVEITVMTLSQAVGAWNARESNFTSLAIQKQGGWTNKDGCATFTIKTEALEINEADIYVTAEARLVENGTGAYSVETALIPVATIRKSVVFVNLHPFYKRGIPYTGKMFCHSEESPLRNETVYLIVDVNDEETELSFLTDEKGEAHFTLDTTSWNSTMVSLRGTYNPSSDKSTFPGESEGDDFHWLKPFYSESDSFLEIKAKNDVMSCDQEQEVQVDYILSQNKLGSEEDHIDFYYLVIAKGRILFSREKKVPITQHENMQGSFSLTLPVGNDFLPDINLLVYAVFSDGEVVADVEQFEVEKCFRHKVELEFSHKEEVPGSKVRLNLKAAPGSLCSVRAVDKSVLLKKNQTLTADSLYEEFFEDSFMVGGRGLPYRLEDFEAYPCLPQQPSPHKKARMGAPWYQSEADVYNLFKKLRMKILTNTRIKKPVSCVLPGFEKKINLRKQFIAGSQATHADSKPHSDDKEKPKPRTLFPETWIWDLVSVGQEVSYKRRPKMPFSVLQLPGTWGAMRWLSMSEHVTLLQSSRAGTPALAANSSSDAEQQHGHVSSAVQLLLVTRMLWDAGELWGGGVDDTISLTAYIAAALVELHLERNDTVLDNALHCLKNVTLDETSLYVKALMAYVFTLSKDMEMRKQLLDMVEKETVAYIVLAHVSKPDLSLSEASVTKLVRWLSTQRNAFGGFASTQDTVVSLQALAQYAALIPQDIRDVKVAVKGKGASPLEFHVHRNNKLVLHQASLLADTGTYTVQATGRGCVYVQTTLYYNIPPPKTEEVFVLVVETVPRDCGGVRKEFDIHVSARYVGDRGTSNMALVEVEMLSGFIPIQSSVKELEKVPLVKKTETKPDKITIYVDELGESSLKLNISVEQDIEVQNLKTATVHVYDYYKPDDRTAREYAFPCSSASVVLELLHLVHVAEA